MRESCAREEIDRLIAAFFSAFDNRNGVTPELTQILSCFAEKAVVARSTGTEIQLYTALEFAAPRIELLSSGTLLNFHEAESSANTSIFDHIAIRTSRYHKSGLLNGAPYIGDGTKLFQVVALDSGWRILSLAWVDDET